MGGFRARAKEWMMEYAYLVTLVAVIAVVAACALYTGELQERQQAALEGIQAAAGAPETVSSPVPEKTTPMPTIAPLEVHYAPLSAQGSVVRPVGGAVVRGWDPALPVLWEALSCVQVHLGLDLAGEAGEGVKCAADGVVERVVLDDLWGVRVEIRQMDGRLAVYAGLESAAVAPGQNVTRAQQLGVLMTEIPCESELGTHLHMELSRDGVSQDPEGMLAPVLQKAVAGQKD